MQGEGKHRGGRRTERSGAAGGSTPPESAPEEEGEPARARHITAPIESDVIRELWSDIHDDVHLVVHWRRGARTALLQEGAPCVVGRSEPSALCIPDVALSREHARFTWQAGSVLVEDLGSTNGTWVRGERVQRATIAFGEQVLLGTLAAQVLSFAAEGGLAPGPRRGPEDAAAAAAGARGGEAGPAFGAKMRELRVAARRFAAARIPVILYGETGSGKEVMARFLHENGPRRGKPMKAINCGAIAAQLVESTLFGNEKGAFTGATEQRMGLFEAASGGTVFLDEVGELPLAAQAALLRVLETGRLCRVGSTREIEVDVRVVAATHRDLEAMCKGGQFRQDLYFRLRGATLAIPPLRERADEIEALALDFMRKANRENGREVRGIRQDAMELLRRYAWPGNVRELKNAIEQAVVITGAEEIRPEDLPPELREDDGSAGAGARGEAPLERPSSGGAREAAAAPSSAGEAGSRGAAPSPGGSAREQVQRHEASMIREALAAAGGVQAEAARRLGMSRRTLVRKISELGLRRDP